MSELKVASCFEFEKVLRGKSNKLFYPKSEVDATIEELKEELYNQKWRGDEWARNANDKDKQIAELKDENRKLKRALWIARAYRGNDNSILLPSKFMRKVWDSVERKCRAKAEEYK